MIKTFIRIGGLLFFGFGLAAILFRIIQFALLGDPPIDVLVLRREFLYLQGIPSLIVAAFFLIGATALYLYQADELGWVGLVSYLLAVAGLVLSAGAMWTYAFTAPELARAAPELLVSPSSGIIQGVIISLALGQLGWLNLVLVSFRSQKLPRWALWASITSLILSLVLAPFAQTQFLRLVFNILLGAGPLIIGYVLWNKTIKD